MSVSSVTHVVFVCASRATFLERLKPFIIRAFTSASRYSEGTRARVESMAFVREARGSEVQGDVAPLSRDGRN